MQIQSLGPDELISRAGVYDIDMARYHGQPTVGASVSSGPLRTTWGKSPAHAWAESRLNPANWELREVEDGDGAMENVFIHDGDRPHFAVGRAAHHLLFMGRAGFDLEYVVRPEKWKDWRTNDAKAWRKDMKAARLTIITDAELNDIAGMARSLAAHPLVKAGLLDGAVERSLIWQDEQTGLWFKSRPDNLVNTSGDASDLKTTVAVDDDSLDRTMGTLGYQMQGAMVGMGMKACMGVEMTSFTLMFVEKTDPWCCRAVEVHPEDLLRGSMQVDAAARQFADSLASGVWPGPGGAQRDATYFPMPAWARNRIDAQLERLKGDHQPQADAQASADGPKGN